MLLGLDLGTTNVKALLVEPDGRIVARGSVPVSLRHTTDGGIEQDIEEIWRATVAAIRVAGEHAALAQVQAVGVSSQGGAIQIRDANGRCTGPVISWLDARGRIYDEDLYQRKGAGWLRQCLGHEQSGVALGQILRLQQTCPDLFKPSNIVGFVGDTIVQRLCGRGAQDCSSLSISCLYSPTLKGLAPELMAELHLEADQLAELLPARAVAGTLTAETAGLTGLPAGIPVGPAVHDQYAATLGCGALEPGQVMFGAGTAWVLVAIADYLMTPVVPSAWVCDHVVPERWGQLLSLAVGGSMVQWVLQVTGRADATREQIDDRLETIAPGCDGLQLLPFLDAVGGRNRPVGGRLNHMRLAHGPDHLLRATVEGLCFELARQLGWLEAGGCPVRQLIMCGGGSRGRVTPQIVADITGLTVVCPRETEVSAFGAAILSRAMLEPDVPLDKLYGEMIGPVREIKPVANARFYAPLLQQYLASVQTVLTEQGRTEIS